GGGGAGANGGGSGTAGAVYGGGGGGTATNSSSAGGGGGGYSQKLIVSPSGTYKYTTGAAGSAGSSAGAGGVGGIVITVYATSSTNSLGNDYAEMFPVSSPGIGAADIVAVDAGQPVSMKLAERGDRALAGAISTDPGQTLGDISATGMRPVALAGRVPVKVNLEGGPIAVGDRIAPSSMPGVGMKAGPFDSSVGIALESFSGGLTSQDSGTVTTMLDIQQGISMQSLGDALLGADTPTATSTDSTDSTSLTASNSPQAASSTPSVVTSFLRSLFARLVQWFADAANGIGDFFANAIHTKEICLSDDMGSSTCVTKVQLDRLLTGQTASAAGQASAQDGSDAATTVSSPGNVGIYETPTSDTPAEGTSTTTDSSSAETMADEEAPVLTLNGANPAKIYTGETYADMGATATDNHDTALYIYGKVDDGPTQEPGTMLTLETTEAADHTVTYTVTDEAGNSSAVTRTVHVVMPEATPSPEVTEEQAAPEPAPETVPEPLPAESPSTPSTPSTPSSP
ncbi:MAG: immunoglobulin-like domain-containing protein, partial [Patescibacteria group bacterium]